MRARVWSSSLVVCLAGVLLAPAAAVAAAPTVSITVADPVLKAGETSPVTFTFSEAVTGFDNTDLTVENGTLSAVSSSDNVTWTATLTPSASITDASNAITVDLTGVRDIATNTPGGVTPGSSNNYMIDTERPTATIAVADNALSIGETSLVTVTFSERVSGFTNADLTIPNGTMSAVTTSDGGATWTATLTPTASVTDPTNAITLANGGIADEAGNTGTGTTDSNNYAVDTVRPTAIINVVDNALTAGETSVVTFTFNEPVTGFDNADLGTIPNGTLSPVASSNGGATWTATLTPTPAVTDTTNVITLDNTKVTDAAGNAGLGTTDSNNYAVGTASPTATILVGDNALRAGETTLVTFTFSRAVTGFTNADLTIPNGILSPVSTSNNGVTWSAVFTPIASVTDPTNVITLANTGVTDLNGNTGVGTTDSNNFKIDTLRPTATIVVADTTLRIGETSPVTITFNEAVSGFTNADLTVRSGTLSQVTSTNGGSSWTATLTPAAAVTDTTNVISLNLAGVTDASANDGTGTASSNNYAVDTVRPTATIALADSALKPGESTPVTITFSEPVTGFANADLTVPNATLTPVTTTNGGTTWTANLTATPGVTDLLNAISLNLAGVNDVAGNAGTGSAVSGNYVVDAVAPTSSATGPKLTSATTWSIGYEASDNSSVGSVTLFVRAPGQSTYVAAGTDTTDQDGTIDYTGSADGTYFFYTVATDAAGNTEPLPASADVTTVLDTTAPGLRARMGGTPVRFDLSKRSTLPLRVSVDERAAVSFRIVTTRGATVRTFGTKNVGPGVVTQKWNGRTGAGRLVAAGKYRLIVLAEDVAGNERKLPVTIVVSR